MDIVYIDIYKLPQQEHAVKVKRDNFFFNCLIKAGVMLI